MTRKVAFASALTLALCGCMASVQQPGQTPAQAQACVANAEAHNWLTGAAGVLAGGATTQASVAAADPNASHALAVSGAITAGVAAGALLSGEYFGGAYASQGCSPALPSETTFVPDAGEGGQ